MNNPFTTLLSGQIPALPPTVGLTRSLVVEPLPVQRMRPSTSVTMLGCSRQPTKVQLVPLLGVLMGTVITLN